jgi:cobalt-zinc-cadmium efflux system outer membrane protein
MVRAARIDLQQLAELAAMKRGGSRTDADRIALQRFNVEAAVHEAELELDQRKGNLAVLLAIPPEKADGLEIAGSLDDRSGQPPPVEALIHLALESRPDLAAQRLGSEYDRALVQVTQAERFDDAAVFFSPYEVQDNSPQGKKSSSGWGGGALFAVPILDRNQGVIARAQINLRQGQIEVEGLERVAVIEVRQAWTEYTSSRQVVQQYEQEGLPAARRVLEEAQRHFVEGKEGIDALLEARKDYSEMIRLYREAQVRHRRSMLKLNTAVGQRILP